MGASHAPVTTSASVTNQAKKQLIFILHPKFLRKKWIKRQKVHSTLRPGCGHFNIWTLFKSPFVYWVNCWHAPSSHSHWRWWQSLIVAFKVTFTFEVLTSSFRVSFSSNTELQCVFVWSEFAQIVLLWVSYSYTYTGYHNLLVQVWIIGQVIHHLDLQMDQLLLVKCQLLPRFGVYHPPLILVLWQVVLVVTITNHQCTLQVATIITTATATMLVIIFMGVYHKQIIMSMVVLLLPLVVTSMETIHPWQLAEVLLLEVMEIIQV